MAITTMDQLVAALGVAQRRNIYFASASTAAAGYFNLTQGVNSSFGTQTAPAAFGAGGTTYNQSGISAGAGFPKWNAATGGATTYLGKMDLASGSSAGSIFIYDLLWQCSGFAGNVATAQNVASFSGMPSRNSTGSGAEIWIGCSSSIGSTPHNVTVGYSNQSGTSGRTTVSTAGLQSMAVGRTYPVPLQAGDTGVSAIANLTLSVSSGTAGNLWVLVVQRIATVSWATLSASTVADFAALGMPPVNDNAALIFVNQASGTSTGTMLGQLAIIQG